jgi:hypothetical protein
LKQKVTVGFVMSVCQFAWKNLASTGWIFMNIFTGGLLLKSVEQVKVWVKENQNTQISCQIHFFLKIVPL